MKQSVKMKLNHISIRYTIFIYFTISAFVAILLIAVSLYTRMSGQLAAAIREENIRIVLYRRPRNMSGRQELR